MMLSVPRCLVSPTKVLLLIIIIFQTFVFGFVLLLLIIDPCSMGLGRWLERMIDKTEFLFLSK